MKKLYVVCTCHQGRKQKMNEDNVCIGNYFLLQTHGSIGFAKVLPYLEEVPVLLGVFDGMGGEQCGETASYIAAKSLSKYNHDMAGNGNKNRNPEALLQEYIQYANQKIFHESQKRIVASMGTTASILGIYKNKIYICNIGDSPAFCFHKGILQKKYREHTDREFLEKNNINNRRPCLTQYLGIDPQEMMLEPFLIEEEWKEDDIYLLCSDGLTDALTKQKIEKILAEKLPLKERASRLLQEALQGESKDNISIMLVKTVKEKIHNE